MKDKLTRYLVSLSITLFPLLTWATAAEDQAVQMSFTPPKTDVSVAFLGKIFGMMPPVLYPTDAGGLVPKMFGIFNVAVLTLGGIVLLYTLLVSTINTAHEGEVLGKKWSSIWIPLRSVMAISLLVPMKSGYCIMQVFMMWVVMQGIGAADTIWSAALDYLKGGGYIIAAPTTGDETTNLYAKDHTLMEKVAGPMLQSLVCMEALRVGLVDLNQAGEEADRARIAALPPGATPEELASKTFPEIPDFIGSVSWNDSNFQDFPDYQSTTEFAGRLQGVCGAIHWDSLTAEQIASITGCAGVSVSGFQAGGCAGGSGAAGSFSVGGGLLSGSGSTSGGMKFGFNTGNQAGGGGPVETSAAGQADAAARLAQEMKIARQTGLSSMYENLALTARSIVNNYHTNYTTGNASPLGKWASWDGEEYGGKSFRPWVASNASRGAPLLSGDELYNSVLIYNAILQPVLAAVASAGMANTNWIESSQRKGWISAGSYFIDMANLNAAMGRLFRDDPSNIHYALPGIMSAESVEGNPQAPVKITFTQVTGYANSAFTTPTLVIPVNQADKDMLTNWQMMSLKTDTPGEYEKNDIGINSFNLINGYRTTDGKYNTELAEYIKNAVDYVPVDALGDTATPKLPFAFTFETIPFLKMNDCWGTFCIGGAMEKVARFMINLLIVPLNAWYLSLQSSIFLPIALAGTELMNDIIMGAVSSGSHPILAMAEGGNSFIRTAGLTFIAVVMANVGAGLTATVAFPLMQFLNPFLFLIITAMLTYGFLFAFYAPLLPFIIFFFASLGWFVAVIEAIVAAPIVALGLAHPEGHEVLGQANPAVCMVVNIFLRPTLLVFGLVFGIILSYVGILLFNQGFGYIINSVMGNVAGIGSMLAPFVIGGIYLVIYLDIVNRSFEVIHLLPDRTLRWIGCQMEGAPGQFAESGKTAQGAVSGMGSSAGGAAERSSGAGTQAAKDVAKAQKEADMGSKPSMTGGGGKGAGGADIDSGASSSVGGKGGGTSAGAAGAGGTPPAVEIGSTGGKGTGKAPKPPGGKSS